MKSPPLLQFEPHPAKGEKVSTEMDPSSDTEGAEPSPLRGLLLFAVPTVLIVGGILFGVNAWLGGDGVGGESGRADGTEREGRPPESDDGRIGFHPKVGAYLLETQVAGMPRRKSVIDITTIGDDTYRITQAYQPPEPFLGTVPEVLAPHLGRIRVRVDITSDGHIADVTGPDDYFEALEVREPGASEPIRALLLEEQIDAHFGWRVRSVLAHSKKPGQTWTDRAVFRSFGDEGEWTAKLHYSLGPGERCGAMSSDELCLPVEIRTEESNDGSSISGTVWVGEDTGVQWASELTLERNDTQREVRTKLNPQ
jgi:hypothetical protein